MNVSFEVRKNYLYVIAEGEFDLADAAKYLQEFLETITRHGLTRAVGDITRIVGLNDNQTSILTRYNVGANTISALPLGFRLAILETEAQVRDGRFGETVMVNRGGLVKMVTSLEDALEYLGVEPPAS
jgi:hypothetical protein